MIVFHSKYLISKLFWDYFSKNKMQLQMLDDRWRYMNICFLNNTI